ncbi:hypothetical protein [Candidatus Tisiphia endosymbiont of Mystacides longicornis]|uniref:hypothetical protein n=1 Tax=Candidatus Tisiphia endosymbiont of Mystacides longicornis TaxID=3139330 RepID=UPI003CCB1C85
MGKKVDEVQESLSAEELKSHVGEMPGTFLALQQLEEVKRIWRKHVNVFLVLLVRLFLG